MDKLFRLLENIWVSVAFTDAGEQEAAQKFMGPEKYEIENAEICQIM